MMRARFGRAGLAPVVLLAGALSACSCDRPVEADAVPEPAPEGPRAEPVTVEIVAGSGLDRRGLAGVDVLAVPGDEMDSHLTRRRAAAERLAALRGEEERLAAEVARLRAANDLSNQAYMVGSAEYLRERAALNLQARSAADASARRRVATDRRMAVRFKAVESAKTALQAERRLERLSRERSELQTTLLGGLPEASATGASGPGGLVELPLAPGRYAVVALAAAAAGHPARSWLAWLVVTAGERPHLVLDDGAWTAELADGNEGGGSR